MRSGNVSLGGEDVVMCVEWRQLRTLGGTQADVRPRERLPHESEHRTVLSITGEEVDPARS